MTNSAIREDWKRVQPRISELVGHGVFDLYFKNTLAIQITPESAEIGVPSAMVADFLQTRYVDMVLDGIEAELGYRPAKIKFSINGHLFRKMREGQRSVLMPEDAEVAPPPKAAPTKERRRKDLAEAARVTQRIFHLNDKLTLENFIVGPSNQLAFNAAMEVARDPDSGRNGPLFIYGATGQGKTHLLQGIALHAERKKPGIQVLYVTGEYFVNQFLTALRNKAIDGFRHRFRQVDLLIIDDVQFLNGKQKCQEELLHTLKTLDMQGKQVVFAAPIHPREFDDLSEFLRSRFVQGMVAELVNPSAQTRVAIIKQKLGVHRDRFPEPTIQYLASKLDCSIRELEGWVTQLVALGATDGNPMKLTVPAVQVLVQEFLGAKPRTIALTDIENVVIGHFGIASNDLHSEGRKRGVARARQVCMYLARRLTQHSLKEIGAFYGGKNHTTVVYAHQKVLSSIESSAELRAVLDRLERQLCGRATQA